LKDTDPPQTTEHSQNPDDREAQVLEALHNHSQTGHHPAQRDLANAVGLSLGMTNAILKRLVRKGFVTMQRMNGRNIHYLVTPDGIELIAKRSYRYLRRTVGHIVRYKDRLREFCRRQRERGVRIIVLVGESDLDFLVEWCAESEGLVYEHRGVASGRSVRRTEGRAVVLISEQIAPEQIPAAAGGAPRPIPIMQVLVG
jgi:DNA-binding MarR family transcriptional regulator